MAESLDRLDEAKNYLKYIYDKIIIATAIAVIKTKPANLQFEEYIELLKSSIVFPNYEKECSNDVKGDSTNLNDVPHQQKILFSKLWAVFPNASQNISEENSHGDEEMEISQDLFANEPIENINDCNSDGAEEADTNMRFIQAIVQLKSVINARSTMSAHKFQDILELFLPPEESGQKELEKINTDNNGSISCCALRYVMRSSETNDLLKFSLQKVLSYLGQSINSSWWDGDDDTSLISHAVMTVKHLIDFASARNECMGFCLETCLKFVTDLVNDIYNGTEINKGEIWERHCMVIIEFCKSRYLCINTISQTIEILISICKELESYLKLENKASNGCCCGPLFNPHRLENSWYLLYITKTLLTYSKKAEWASSTNRDCVGSEVSDIQKIRDLWRLSWKNNDSHPVKDDSWNGLPSLAPVVTLKWKEQLNKYVKCFSQIFPLFTYDLYECEKLLS